MFNIGDNIFYPLHGTGVISEVQEKKVANKIIEYFVINMISTNMELMIPISRIETSNIRPINSDSTLTELLNHYETKVFNHSEMLPTKEAFQKNTLKLKSGNIHEELEVIFDLVNMNKIKPLNASEKQLLTTARKFLIDEISLIRNISIDDSNQLFNKIFDII